MASFACPIVYFNEEGWGPTVLPEAYVGLPFALYNKNDRLGRAATEFAKDPRFRRGFRDRDGEPVVVPEDTFSTVQDPTRKSSVMRARGRGGFRGRWQVNRRFLAKRNEEPAKVLKGKQAKYLTQYTKRGKQWRRRGAFRPRWNQRNLPTLEASVKVADSWEMLEQFDMSALTKMRLAPPTGEDLRTCGHLFRYDDKFERVTTKTPVKIKRFGNVQFSNASTMDDPVIQGYAQEYSREGKGEKVVFATDEILAHLMASPRSVLPWDVYFTRLENGLMFIDKREDSGLEMLTVNETMSQRQLQDNEKLTIMAWDQPDNLSIEATAINQNFSQQAVNKEGKRKRFPNPNPFWDAEDEASGSEPASFAYKYRKWQLGATKDVTLVARTELHAYQRKTGAKRNTYMTLYALNEANSRVSGAPAWRQKLDSARGSVLAGELKNNACKIGKWTAQSMLAGADLMKVGFVSRTAVKPVDHVLLGTQFYKPDDFAVQINLQKHNMWGILKTLIDTVYKHPVGKYVLMRDPNKPTVQLFAVPFNTFAEDDDEDEDEDDDDDGEYADEE